MKVITKVMVVEYITFKSAEAKRETQNTQWLQQKIGEKKKEEKKHGKLKIQNQMVDSKNNHKPLSSLSKYKQMEFVK